MKKEQLFDAIGDIHEDILARHNQMDQELARKYARKRGVLRVLAVAACFVLVIALSLPIAALAHPAGRAVLRGDSEALTEYLVGIDGFAAWQEITAEQLEQALPENVWEILQTTPIVNVLTQSQYPDYAWKSTTFAPLSAGMAEPEVLVYALDDKVGYFYVENEIDAGIEQYTDENAAESYSVEVEGVGYELQYAYSVTQSFDRQAVHVYELNTDQGTYLSYLDAKTGECIYWSSPERAGQEPGGGASVDDMTKCAYDMLAQRVRDPEAYGVTANIEGDLYIVEYSREFVAAYLPKGSDHVINPVVCSCDRATFTFDAAGNMVCFDLAYLGALRNAEKVVPEEIYTLAEEYFRATFLGEAQSKIVSDVHDTPYRVVITADGGLALKHEFTLDLTFEATVSMGYIVPMVVGEIESAYEIEDHSDRVRVLLSTASLTKGSSTVYENDQQGRIIGWTSRDKQGVIQSTGMRAYDEQGNMIEERIFDALGNETEYSLYQYDEQGRVIFKEDGFYGIAITYSYDQNGNYVKTTEQLSDGSVETAYVEIVKDDSGNVLNEKQYDRDGVMIGETVYEYDEQNRLLKQEKYLSDGVCAEAYEYEYRENEIATKEYVHGVLLISQVEYLNRFGEPVFVEMIHFSATQEIHYQHTATYGYLEP